MKHIDLHVLLVLALVLTAPLASAEQAEATTDNQLLQQGLELYEELEYERAVEVLSAALLEQDNDEGEQILIFRTLGTLYVLLGREQEAGLALTRLLCVAPDFEFDQFTSPRIRDVFDAVRGGWQEQGQPCQETPREPAAPQPVTIDHESPATTTAGAALELRAVVEDPGGRVASLVIHYRVAGESGWNRMDGLEDSPGLFVAAIPADAVSPPATQYYIQALDDQGAEVAAAGTARAPLGVPITGGGTNGSGDGRRSVVRTWWFWTIMGVLVAGAATGIVLGIRLSQDDPPQPPPDPEAILNINVCDPELGLCP